MPQVSRLERFITTFFRDPKIACTVSSFNDRVMATDHLHSLMILPMPLFFERVGRPFSIGKGRADVASGAGPGRSATRNGGPRRGLYACKLTLFASAESERVPCQSRDAPDPGAQAFPRFGLVRPDVLVFFCRRACVYRGLRTAGARKNGDRPPAVKPTGQRQGAYQAASPSPFFPSLWDTPRKTAVTSARSRDDSVMESRARIARRSSSPTRPHRWSLTIRLIAPDRGEPSRPERSKSLLPHHRVPTITRRHSVQARHAPFKQT